MGTGALNERHRADDEEYRQRSQRRDLDDPYD